MTLKRLQGTLHSVINKTTVRNEGNPEILIGWLKIIDLNTPVLINSLLGLPYPYESLASRDRARWSFWSQPPSPLWNNILINNKGWCEGAWTMFETSHFHDDDLWLQPTEFMRVANCTPLRMCVPENVSKIKKNKFEKQTKESKFFVYFEDWNLEQNLMKK